MRDGLKYFTTDSEWDDLYKWKREVPFVGEFLMESDKAYQKNRSRYDKAFDNKKREKRRRTY